MIPLSDSKWLYIPDFIVQRGEDGAPHLRDAGARVVKTAKRLIKTSDPINIMPPVESFLHVYICLWLKWWTPPPPCFFVLFLSCRPPVGLTVGYVGASHIPDYKEDTHAEMLMAGGRAENGKGAEIVISDMTDLIKIIEFFAGEKTAGKSAPFEFPSVSALRPPRPPPVALASTHPLPSPPPTRSYISPACVCPAATLGGEVIDRRDCKYGNVTDRRKAESKDKYDIVIVACVRLKAFTPKQTNNRKSAA